MSQEIFFYLGKDSTWQVGSLIKPFKRVPRALRIVSYIRPPRSEPVLTPIASQPSTTLALHIPCNLTFLLLLKCTTLWISQCCTYSFFWLEHAPPSPGYLLSFNVPQLKPWLSVDKYATSARMPLHCSTVPILSSLLFNSQSLPPVKAGILYLVHFDILTDTCHSADMR